MSDAHSQKMSFAYGEKFRLQTFAFPVVIVALTVWLVQGASTPAKILVTLMCFVCLLATYVLVTSPIRLELNDRVLVAQYYGGASRSWEISELSIPVEPGLVSMVFTALEVRAANGKFAFRLWKALPGYEDLIRRLG